MAGRRRKHEEVEIAGVKRVVNKNNKCSGSSRSSITIRLIPTKTETLENKEFQIKQAKKLWKGLYMNLPYGIYIEFIKIITKHLKFMSKH